MARVLASRLLWEANKPTDPDSLPPIQRPARPEQLPPENFSTWLIQSGRGWGKTRTGAEWLVWEALKLDNSRWAVVARTFAEGRKVCVEGESGLLSVINRYGVLRKWNKSSNELTLTNGSIISVYTSDKPDGLRGSQHHGAWCDELSSWLDPDSWDQLQFTLRLGPNRDFVNKVVITTTPKPTALFKSIAQRDDVLKTYGKLQDNAANLTPAFVSGILNQYGNTRLGRQEIDGELLLDSPGALWQYDMIQAYRVESAPALQRVLVAIDPATTNNADSDFTGICIVGKGTDGRGYVLADWSCKMSADGWAKRVIEAFDKFQADRVIVEDNQGGDAWATILRQYRPSLPIKQVNSRRDKVLRAEPIAALYEQGRVSHVGFDLNELEDQMITWVDGESDYSPDRIDALVHGMTELGIGSGSSADNFLRSIAPPCPNCGMPVAAGSSNCPSCGAHNNEYDLRQVYPR